MSPPFLFARRDVVVGIGAGISRLDLGSREWTTVKDSTEIQATMAVEDARGRYWLATTRGVHALMPDGYGWEVFPMGLQREEIVSLSVDRQGYLIAATRAHGLYRARLP